MAKAQPYFEIPSGETVQVTGLTASTRYRAENRSPMPIEFTFAASLTEADTLSWQICRDGNFFEFEHDAGAPLFVRSGFAGRLAIRDA